MHISISSLLTEMEQISAVEILPHKDMVNTVAADGLVTQVPRPSTAMILTLYVLNFSEGT